MNRCPRIGDRVRHESLYFGTLTGTVVEIYVTHDDEYDDETGKFTPGPPRPESRWHVGIKLDVLPPNWSRMATDRYAMEVSELTLPESQ